MKPTTLKDLHHAERVIFTAVFLSLAFVLGCALGFLVSWIF